MIIFDIIYFVIVLLTGAIVLKNTRSGDRGSILTQITGVFLILMSLKNIVEIFYERFFS